VYFFHFSFNSSYGLIWCHVSDFYAMNPVDSKGVLGYPPVRNFAFKPAFFPVFRSLRFAALKAAFLRLLVRQAWQEQVLIVVFTSSLFDYIYKSKCLLDKMQVFNYVSVNLF